MVEDDAGGRTSQDPFELVVAAVGQVAPSLLRIELGGADLARYIPLGASDEAAVLHVPLDSGGHDTRGRWYTICDVRDGASGPRLVVEMVTHEGGVGASWARRARQGDRVVLSTRSSWFRRPADARWQLLLGDVAALPALSRIVAESPPGLRTTAVVEVPDHRDRRALPGAEVTWVHRPDLGAGSGLADLARRAVLPAGPGYVYAAGEAAATRGVRRHLRHELGLSPSRYAVIGYWRLDAERWIRRYEQSMDTFERIWRDAESAGRDDEEVRDIYEAGLAEAGLL
ncbi:MAG: siderophore-interacting protein [Pseudonocardia sp.]|nr:siderophore-interacting protein [Pseudonocardia sp.]